jgi:prepilin-type N-terminal cleavage/methylation domain-containing protein
MYNPFKVNNRKGFTLVEVIISLAIVGIVAAMAFTFFNFGNRTAFMSFSKNQTQTDLRTTSEYLVSNLRNATEIELNPSVSIPINQTDPYDYIYFNFSSGKVVHSSYNNDNTRIIQNIGNGIQSNSTFWVEKNGNVQTLGLNLHGKDREQNFDLQTSFTLPNLSLNGNLVEDQYNATMIKFLVDTSLTSTPPPTTTSGETTSTEETTSSQLTVTAGVIIKTTNSVYKNNHVYRITLETVTTLETTESSQPYSVSFANVWPGNYNLKVERKKKNEDDTKYVLVGNYEFIIGSEDITKEIDDN